MAAEFPNPDPSGSLQVRQKNDLSDNVRQFICKETTLQAEDGDEAKTCKHQVKKRRRCGGKRTQECGKPLRKDGNCADRHVLQDKHYRRESGCAECSRINKIPYVAQPPSAPNPE
jgi:hypothetical protein